MVQIDLKSRKPIYEQIVDNMKRLILSGAIGTNDKIPSVRELAKNLAVNPNTIHKAYRELENKGYLYSVIGQGNYVAQVDKHGDMEVERLYSSLVSIVRELILYGQNPKHVLYKVQQILENGGSHDNG
ncbi:MAG: GntR family transcriptional regulator [Clostridiales bacterium]|jgi:GntR family transcriptional regulator|nr:GntR family transcriptional regulator [Clostridiales bacterium]